MGDFNLLADQEWAHTANLASAVGRWTWGARLKRELLSIPSLTFIFLHKFEDRVARLRSSVRRELKAMALATLFMFADLSLPVSTTIWATDAQGADAENDCGGFGVAVCMSLMCRAKFFCSI